MDVQIATLCDTAVDYNGKLVIVGTFDTIVGRALPALLPPCALALRLVFRKEHEKRDQHKLHIDLSDEEGKQLAPPLDATLEVQLAPDASFFAQNLVLAFQAVAFPKAGLYSLNINLDGRRRASIPLQVQIIAGDGAAGARGQRAAGVEEQSSKQRR